MKKKLIVILAAALCLVLLAGCGDVVISPQPTAEQTVTESEGGETQIALTDGGIEISGGGAGAKGSALTISSPGSYRVSGSLSDGSITVDTGEVKGDVTITLAGADVNCLDGAAINVVRAKNVYLVLADGSENRLVSGREGDSGALGADANGAAIFSESDLDILGGGRLEIFGYINNGVTCKDDLDIKGGTIVVTAAKNGIKGSESVEISGGEITVSAQNDGVKATSVKKDGKGFVSVSGGRLEISCGGDGISAESYLSVTGGEISVDAHGTAEASSCKALKAKTGLEISDGELKLTSTGHSVHCTEDIVISGGTLTLRSTGGKGVSAHGTLMISGGVIDAESADDGLESKTAVVISGGGISVLAGADGIKAGDSLSNTGTIEIMGGVVDVSAHSDPINAKTSAVISGGWFSGVGTPKRVKGFSPDSTQLSLVFALRGGENTSAEVRGASGKVIGNVNALCGYTMAIFSCPELTEGEYSLVLGTLSADARA